MSQDYMNELAAAGYEAYRRHTGGVSLVSGAKLPEWAGMTPTIRDAWVSAAIAMHIKVLSDLPSREFASPGYNHD